MNITIDRSSPTPIFKQIEELILDGIQSGEMKPGERIPSQYEIAQACDVSRATIQKALDRLITDELLYYQPGKGIYVSPQNERMRLPILQSVSQSLRVLGYRVRADLLLAEEITGSRSVTQSLQIANDERVVHVKRLQYVDDVPIALQDVFMDASRFGSFLDRDLGNEALTEIFEEEAGTFISGSSITGAAAVSNWEESRVLNIQVGMALLSLERTDFDGDERPIRFSRNRLRGDRFRMVASTMKDREISLEYLSQPANVSITLL